MPKSARRVTFTRTVTFTYTADMANFAANTDAEALAAANLPGGVNSVGELLSGSLAANGSVVRAAWSVSGTGTVVEPTGLFVPSVAYTVGQRLAPSTNPLNRLFVVRTAGTAGASEPTWNNTIGATTVSSGVTFMAVDKFANPVTRANSTAYTVGQILRPSGASLKEYLVVTGGTSAASAPSFVGANDALGATVADGTASLLCIGSVSDYASLTSYFLGDVVTPNSSSTEEYLCITAGRMDLSASTALTAALNATVTIGTATFRRLV